MYILGEFCLFQITVKCFFFLFFVRQAQWNKMLRLWCCLLLFPLYLHLSWPLVAGGLRTWERIDEGEIYNNSPKMTRCFFSPRDAKKMTPMRELTRQLGQRSRSSCLVVSWKCYQMTSVMCYLLFPWTEPVPRLNACHCEDFTEGGKEKRLVL